MVHPAGRRAPTGSAPRLRVRHTPMDDAPWRAVVPRRAPHGPRHRRRRRAGLGPGPRDAAGAARLAHGKARRPARGVAAVMRIWSLLALAALAAVAPAPARAAGCPKGAMCGVLTVPLDHTGVTAGTLPLAYARMPATGTRTGTIVLLSGGPGQAAIPFTVSFSALVKPVRASNDLVFVDQRGTGRSGAVDCGRLLSVEDVTACGERLGARRPFLSTTET